MIDIYRSGYDCKLNLFNGKESVKVDEVKLITRSYRGESYTFAEPRKEGNWAFGGTLLYTSNGIHPEFNKPIKLHDRNMSLER